MADCANDIEHTTKRWHRLHKSIVKARSVLVRETITLFEFKPGVVEDSSSPAIMATATKYSKEELNAAIGHLTHMLGLITRYLGVKLPFPVFHKTMYPYVRSATAKLRHSSKMPLFLDDKNLRRFTIGMAMLNYDIAYLCHSQGVEIQLSQVANSLQALMACCRSQRLGL
ncbi:UV radiation resistance protein/autophagy-related protein 14 [Zychaea mexicana]|uniref:UV radiation resistance protein/autophagy-related protein 14 n=1 Tax=Zychaea mexicana TaxID=64656 RepID=UPI0022FE5BB2|nr:UV radiation resistance protein/autophagy-related protein 14 [Zychaea mexicana]KAI9487929.1 UV radiation resistance protein/autophagy-related protein 14 [Zychaea mexicana]